VNELFPPGVPASVEPGAILDVLVTQLSQDMVDDYPASDPRWAESLPPGNFASIDVVLHTSARFRQHNRMMGLPTRIICQYQFLAMTVSDVIAHC